VNFKILFVQK